MTKYLSQEELTALDDKELIAHAESIGTKIDGRLSKDKKVMAILGFQEANPEDDDLNTPDAGILQEPTKEEKEEEISTQETKEESEPKEEVSDNSQVAHTSQVNLIDALTDVLKQSSNQVKVHGNTNLIKTPEGKRVHAKMRKEMNQMVLVKLNKNNQRMTGERFVIFDIGNDLLSIVWNIRLDRPYYVPKILIPFIQKRAYQKFEMSEGADVPVVVGNGDAVSSVNFRPELAQEFTLTILEDTGETASQIAERLSKKKQSTNSDAGTDLFESLAKSFTL